jgi:hypothetical protein
MHKNTFNPTVFQVHLRVKQNDHINRMPTQPRLHLYEPLVQRD